MKIGIAGKIRSGKDTVGNILINEYDFERFAFGDGIAEIIKKYFPEEWAKGKPRKHYQHIGQQLRELNPYVWIDYLDRMVKSSNAARVIITDVRQKNEEIYLRENGYMIIKVEAPVEIRLERIKRSGDTTTAEQLEHDTEKQVDLIQPDYVISNSRSLADLHQEVEKALVFYSKLMKGASRHED